MRLDHISYVASHDQISDVVNRIGSQIGTAFTLTATTLNDIFPSGVTKVTTTINFLGRNSGARLSIPFTVNKKV